jgi:hypothetical protein
MLLTKLPKPVHTGRGPSSLLIQLPSMPLTKLTKPIYTGGGPSSLARAQRLPGEGGGEGEEGGRRRMPACGILRGHAGLVSSIEV